MTRAELLARASGEGRPIADTMAPLAWTCWNCHLAGYRRRDDRTSLLRHHGFRKRRRRRPARVAGDARPAAPVGGDPKADDFSGFDGSGSACYTLPCALLTSWSWLDGVDSCKRLAAPSSGIGDRLVLVIDEVPYWRAACPTLTATRPNWQHRAGWACICWLASQEATDAVVGLAVQSAGAIVGRRSVPTSTATSQRAGPAQTSTRCKRLGDFLQVTPHLVRSHRRCWPWPTCRQHLLATTCLELPFPADWLHPPTPVIVGNAALLTWRHWLKLSKRAPARVDSQGRLWHSATRSPKDCMEEFVMTKVLLFIGLVSGWRAGCWARVVERRWLSAASARPGNARRCGAVHSMALWP